MDKRWTPTPNQTLPVRSHFGNPFLIMNPPEKSFREPLSDHEGKPKSPEKGSEKGFSSFRKTAPMLFNPKPRDAPPLAFISQSPQFVLGPLYLNGAGPREARFVWGGGYQYQLPGCTTMCGRLPFLSSKSKVSSIAMWWCGLSSYASPGVDGGDGG